MAHRILTPSSPYTLPLQHSHSDQHAPTRHSTKSSLPLPVPLPLATGSSHSSRHSHGKENSTHHHHHHQESASSPPLGVTPASPCLSSPQVSTFTVPAAPASHYTRPSPPLPNTAVFPSPAATHANMPTAPYHRPLAPQQQSPEPTVAQLLGQQPTGISSYPSRMQHADRDSTMANATGLVSWRKGQGFKEWEKVKLQSPEVKRKADVAQLCE